jgi:hypothetical protein
MTYRPVFSGSAVTFFATLSRRRQWKLLDRTQELANDPFLVPDFRSTDDDDREISHVLTDGFLISYWVDHPAQSVLILDIEDGT